MKKINKEAITKFKIWEFAIDNNFVYSNKKKWPWSKSTEELIIRYPDCSMIKEKHSLESFKEKFKTRFFNKETSNILYKPHIEFYLNNGSCEEKYFETIGELKEFYDIELSDLKLIEV